MRRIILIIASLLVSGIFLWLVLRDVPVADVMDSIARADLFWLAVLFIATTIGLYTRAIRWRGLLGFRISTRDAFHIVNITFLMNQLPMRAGEVARSLLATRSGIPVMTAATSIIVERLLDTLLVVVVLTISITSVPDVPDSVTSAATLFGVASVFGTMMLVFFARFPAIAHNILQFILRLLPILNRLPLEKLLNNVLDGLQPLTQWRSASHAIIWTLISWTTSLIGFYCVHRALNVEGVNLWLSSALGMSLASFSIAIPMTILSIGPFEAAIRVTGEILGMQEVVSTSLGLLIHGMVLLGYALWGTIGIIATGASLGEMFTGKQSPRTST